MRFAGYSKGPVDELLTDAQLDQRRRHEWMRLKEEFDRAVAHANREALSKLMLTRETLLRLAVTTAELRAAYLKKGIEVGTSRHPPPALVEEVAVARRAFEEASATFEAVERALERGYVNLPTA
jgi:uncharacterized protein (DUF1684 family)